MTAPPPASSEAQRRRRAHKKSRRGCSSCKLRRVKCDEERPCCKKCKDFGVACAYDAKVESLRFAGESSFDLNETQHAKIHRPTASKTVEPHESLCDDGNTLSLLPSSGVLSQPSAIVGHVNGLASPPDSDAEDRSHAFDLSKLKVFTRFNERTVLSVGTKQSAKIYQQEVFRLACRYPFLEDIVITLTLLHDRHLNGSPFMSRKILSHWCHGTAKFKETLMQPLRSESRDALWASAALLGVIQFAAFEARTPEEAWPLRPNHSSDLDWLKMSDGKKAVFAIADPLRADSVFQKTAIRHNTLLRAMSEPEHYHKIDKVEMTRDFSDMFGLDPSTGSSPANNPYYKPAMLIARLLHVTCDSINIIEFLVFIMHVSPELKCLLDQKDAKALLLVAYWYAKLYRAHWWCNRRGLTEGQAICLYLDRYHRNDAKLQRMLRWPKAEFGLDVTAEESDVRTSQWASDAATVLCVV